MDAKDESGYTLLMTAALWNENPEVINALVAAGADVNSENEHGETPLICADEAIPGLSVRSSGPGPT